MKSELLVSVLMTSFNREYFIAESIESVLESTYKNFELIIVDDCSTDNTLAIAHLYASNDTRIRVYRNDVNLGDYPNRNRSVSLANGEFIMFCDSDDKLYPDSISYLVKIATADEDFNIGMYWPHSNETFRIDSTTALRMHFFDKQFLYIGPGGTFMRRTFFNDLKGYPEKYGPANDMYFNLKAACYSSLTLVDYKFIFYRIHSGQEVNNHTGYLYQNYCYMRDALVELPFPFDDKEIIWLKKKNKRRFTINTLSYFLKTLNIKSTMSVIKQAEFTLRDALVGIFH